MLRSRSITRIFGILVMLACLFVGFTLLSVVRPSRRPFSVSANQPPPTVKLLRKLKLDGLKRFGFSSSGRHFWTLGTDDSLGVYNLDGSRCYRARSEDANRIVVAPDGSAMLYSRQNPAVTRVSFLDRRGRAVWDMDFRAAVWSADACMENEDSRFVVGTGDSHIYVIDVGDRTRHYRRWSTPGAVVSLVLERSGKHVSFTTWQAAAIAHSTITGSRLWQARASQESLNYVDPLATDSRMLVRSDSVSAGLDGSYTLLNARGKTVISGAVRRAENASVVVSPDGRYLCLGSSQLIRHKGRSMKEKHVVLMDDNGAVLWEKGSLFFGPEPLLVAGGGYTVISDGKNGLFLVKPSGQMDSLMKLPSRVERSAVSPDGSRAILQCGSSLHLIAVK